MQVFIVWSCLMTLRLLSSQASGFISPNSRSLCAATTGVAVSSNLHQGPILFSKNGFVTTDPTNPMIFDISSTTSSVLKRSQSRSRRISMSSIQRQRRSVGTVQMMGLFGLGIPELLIIVVAIAFVMGPERLAQFFRLSAVRANEIKEELKQVPSEFKKGMEEGEMEARSRNARPMKTPRKSENDE